MILKSFLFKIGYFFKFNPTPIIIHLTFLFRLKELSTIIPPIFFLFKCISLGHLYLTLIFFLIFFNESPIDTEVTKESWLTTFILHLGFNKIDK